MTEQVTPSGADERLVLRLFVAGDGPNSLAARANLKRLLDARNPATYSVEIVDCLVDPMRAIEEGVLVTPTLLRLSPPPRRTVVGSLSESSQVVSALDLDRPLGPDATR
ncbi:MAG TPA: circadian clock KaiB family protein [Gemmatimonadaceae bacterium]|jgi:circadian clock protein KaiB